MTDRVARRVTVVVLLAVALAGCAGPRPAPPRPTRTTSVSPTPGQPSIADPDRACRGGIPFYSGSPAYAGPGPHLMIGFPLHDDSLSQRIILNDLPSRLPDAWAADQSDVPEVFAVGPDVSTFQHAQLILCMSPPQVTGRKTERASTATPARPSRVRATVSRSTWWRRPTTSPCSSPAPAGSWSPSA